MSGILETYRTDSPEKCIRALHAKYGRVWVNQVFDTNGKVILRKGDIADLPIYKDARGNTLKPLSAWERYGGIVLQSFTDSLQGHTPSVPALLILECPTTIQKLTIATHPARDAFVVLIPVTWRLHEMRLAQLHPGRVACEAFYEHLMSTHQRMSDDHAAMAWSMGHELSETAAIEADQYTRYEYHGRALEILPDTGAPSVWPVKIIGEPDPFSPVLPTYRVILDRAPDVAGYKLVYNQMFDDLPGIHWKTHITRMRRSGVLYAAPQLSFLSVKKEPQYAHAEEQHQAALRRLQQVIKLVLSWPEYPIGGVRGRLKPPRIRAPRTRASRRGEAAPPDSAD